MVVQGINELQVLMSNWSDSVCKACLEKTVCVGGNSTDLVPSSSRKYSLLSVTEFVPHLGVCLCWGRVHHREIRSTRKIIFAIL